jgi:hypothetical protein
MPPLASQGRLLVVGWLASCGVFLFSWLFAAVGEGPPQGVLYWTCAAVPLYLLTVWWFRVQGIIVRGLVVYASISAWLFFAKRMLWATLQYSPRPLSDSLTLYAVVLPPTLTVTAVVLVSRRLLAAERHPGIARDDA